jgi:hypothetical protein
MPKRSTAESWYCKVEARNLRSGNIKVSLETLTLLALHVDPSFLTGRLHHEGGIFFFLLALAIMYPVWKLLYRSERKTAGRGIASLLPYSTSRACQGIELSRLESGPHRFSRLAE